MNDQDKYRIIRVLRKHRNDCIALKEDFHFRYGECGAVDALRREIGATEDTIFHVQSI